MKLINSLRGRPPAVRILTLWLVALPVALQAQYTYWTNNDDTITITAYTGSDGVVAIPGTINGLPVTSIGQEAFTGASMTGVIIPNSVTSIGYGAFRACPGLTSVTLPNSVTGIEPYAFANCTGLTTVTIPGSMTALGWGVLNGCTTLTNITVDALNPAFSTLGGVLFNKGLNTLVTYPGGRRGVYFVPNGVTYIGDWGFYSCLGLTDVVIPDSIVEIGGSAFESCTGLTRVMIPDSVVYLDTRAFYGCSALTNVAVPDSVISIGCSIFVDCTSLKTVNIGRGVTALGACEGGLGSLLPVFAGCTNLEGVYFAGDAPAARNIFGDDATNITVYYLPNTTGWGSIFGGRPAVLWNPVIQVGNGGFGVRPQSFGFDIAGTTNIPFVVEASTTLTASSWMRLQSLTLTNGLVTFSDATWTNHSARFYRIRSP